MARPNVYQPAVSRPLIAVLFHEARHRGIPMTRLVDRLLSESLRGTPGWQKASLDWPELAARQKQDRQNR